MCVRACVCKCQGVCVYACVRTSVHACVKECTGVRACVCARRWVSHSAFARSNQWLHAGTQHAGASRDSDERKSMWVRNTNIRTTLPFQLPLCHTYAPSLSLQQFLDLLLLFCNCQHGYYPPSPHPLSFAFLWKMGEESSLRDGNEECVQRRGVVARAPACLWEWVRTRKNKRERMKARAWERDTNMHMHQCHGACVNE